MKILLRFYLTISIIISALIASIIPVHFGYKMIVAISVMVVLLWFEDKIKDKIKSKNK